jgi:hypothetical protein
MAPVQEPQPPLVLDIRAKSCFGDPTGIALARSVQKCSEITAVVAGFEPSTAAPRTSPKLLIFLVLAGVSTCVVHGRKGSDRGALTTRAANSFRTEERCLFSPGYMQQLRKTAQKCQELQAAVRSLVGAAQDRNVPIGITRALG